VNLYPVDGGLSLNLMVRTEYKSSFNCIIVQTHIGLRRQIIALFEDKFCTTNISFFGTSLLIFTEDEETDPIVIHLLITFIKTETMCPISYNTNSPNI
jgi:hypothetical protein